MALAMGSGDVISDVTVTLRVLRGEQQLQKFSVMQDSLLVRSFVATCASAL